jgi:hypothetical protein
MPQEDAGRVAVVDSLHLVAAVFPDWAEARAARSDLFELLDVEDGDVAVGPAGGDAGGRGPALLAGRFRVERLTEVEAVVAEHAGTVLVDIPENRAGYPPVGSPPTA